MSGTICIRRFPEPGCAGPGPRPSPGNGEVMASEGERGPSWARDNWPLIELDEVNAGLDPTAHGDREGRRQGEGEAAAGGASEAEIRQAAAGFDQRDDADPHLSGARASRRRSRSAGPRQARAAGGSDARISRLHRRRGARPPGLARRRARLRDGDGARDRRGPAPQLLRATSASNICTSTISRSAASCRTGWRARTPRSSSPPRARNRS